MFWEQGTRAVIPRGQLARKNEYSVSGKQTRINSTFTCGKG